MGPGTGSGCCRGLFAAACPYGGPPSGSPVVSRLRPRLRRHTPLPGVGGRLRRRRPPAPGARRHGLRLVRPGGQPLRPGPRPRDLRWSVVGAVAGHLGRLCRPGRDDPLVQDHWKLLPGLPLWIVENGLCNRVRNGGSYGQPDGWDRPRYLAEHVSAVMDAVAAGVPVTAYLHWSLIALDNYEWGIVRTPVRHLRHRPTPRAPGGSAGGWTPMPTARTRPPPTGGSSPGPTTGRGAGADVVDAPPGAREGCWVAQVQA